MGGLQGVFQNLGSSLGTALIGSILIGALATSFASGVAAEHAARRDVQTIVNERDRGRRRDRPGGERSADRGGRRPERGRGRASSTRSTSSPSSSSLRIAFFGLIVLALLSLLVSRGIPNEVPLRTPQDATSPRRPRPDRGRLARGARRLPWDGDHRRRPHRPSRRRPHPDRPQPSRRRRRRRVRVVPREGGCGGHRAPRGRERLHAGAHGAPGGPARDGSSTRSRAARSRPTSRCPTRHGDWWYYGRTVEGKQYGIQCRAPLASADDWTPPELSPDVDGARRAGPARRQRRGRGPRVLLARQLRGLERRHADALRRRRRRRRALHRAGARPGHRRAAARRDPRHVRRRDLLARRPVHRLHDRRRRVAPRHRLAARARHARSTTT